MSLILNRNKIPALITLVTLIVACFISDFALAQTGGTFDLSHSVIATGGGRSTGDLNGRTLQIDGTTGQSIAGTESIISGGGSSTFAIRGGFWIVAPIAPTAAAVSVSGRVTSATGLPIARARVSIMAPDGTVRVGISNPFGFFRIDGVEVGRTYIVNVHAKGARFVPAAINIDDQITDLNLIALP